MQYIAIFASGNGTNAQEIINYFAKLELIKVGLIISDKAEPGVAKIASENHIPFLHIPFEKIKDQSYTFQVLRQFQIDFIVLAGYLRLIPDYLLRKYPNKIINIHPALLPKYGGKGMYGHKVHQKVKDANEKETGISIHLVNEEYDKGRVIFQKKTSIDASDSVEEIAQKVRTLEHNYYPKVIHQWILNF